MSKIWDNDLINIYIWITWKILKYILDYTIKTRTETTEKIDEIFLDSKINFIFSIILF